MKTIIHQLLRLDVIASRPAAISPAAVAPGRRLIPLLLCGLATLALAVPEVNAGQIWNGWNYAIDAPTDGSGGSAFEERGLAFLQRGQTGYFAISGGVPQAGVPYSARNGNVSLGDLFLNFSSHNLDTPGEFNDPQVFAIRFASANDSWVNGDSSQTGLFRSVTPMSYTTANSGYAKLQDYYGASPAHRPVGGAMGDLNTASDVISYLGDGVMYPNITRGSLVSGISVLDRDALDDLDLDFAHFGADPVGNRVFGFSVDLSRLPAGKFTAHFFEECINDGIALSASHVPEPGTLALLGLALACVVTRRR
jgi:hypothetical protein